MPGEAPAEVAEIAEPAREARLRNAPSLPQHGMRGVQADLAEVSVGRPTDELGERAPEMKHAHADGARQVEAAEFFRGLYETDLRPGEVVTAVTIPPCAGYRSAIAELAQANQQNPDVLYLLGVSYQGKADGTKAKASFTKAAKFNSLPQLNYAFVRSKAEKALAT